MFEVPAGGRRYRALELLVKQKRMIKTEPVPCVVSDAHSAVPIEEDSLAENFQREDLHPLDMFRAFQTLHDQGASHEEIAARFFVSATFVQQRLRLARVSAKLQEVYEQDGMQLEQLMAFTVTDDHTRQEQVWEALENSWSKEPQQIRRLLSQLKVFREVLRAGSTRRAAAALGISQPAVSQHVKQLEITLGITLFKRSANRIVPLQEAWELLRNVELALTSLDRLEASIFAMKNEEKQRIAIAAPSVFGFVTLPKVVAIIHSKTASNVRSISGSYEQIGEHILAGRADLGISRLPLDPRLFEWAPLGSARNVCIFHPDHRFSKQTCIEAQDLAGETIVDIDPQFAAHQMNFNALRFAGVEPDILVEFDCNGHEAGYVSAGLGISITNEIIAREYAAFHLEAKPVEPSALYHYVAIWQKGRTFSNALNVSLEAIIAAFSQMPSARGGSSLEG